MEVAFVRTIDFLGNSTLRKYSTLTKKVVQYLFTEISHQILKRNTYKQNQQF